MSIQALAWAFAAEVPSGAIKATLLALADHADKAGRCFPGQKRLARMSGNCERAVRKHLAWLAEAGLIIRERRARPDGTRASDRYSLAIPKAKRHEVPPQAARDAGHEPSANPNQHLHTQCKEAGRARMSGGLDGRQAARRPLAKPKAEKLKAWVLDWIAGGDIAWPRRLGAPPLRPGSIAGLDEVRERWLWYRESAGAYIHPSIRAKLAAHLGRDLVSLEAI